MKVSGKLSIALLIMALSLGCSQLHDWVRQPGPNQPADAPRPVSTKVRSERETIAGQVVLVAQGYRFRPNDQPNKEYRLSRADISSELANQEIGLRKYYGKTLVVKGRKQDDWLADAAVIGQFLKPGESAGPNTTAPPEPGR